MIKKLAAVLMAMALLCACACAQEIPFADTGLDEEVLYARYGAQADETGFFVAMTPKAKAIEKLFNGKIMTYAAGGMLMFNVQVEGNYETGISYPVLRVVYAGSAPLNAECVMISAGGETYRITAACETASYGRYRVETMKTYLSQEGLEMISAVRNAGGADITILGSEQYTQSAKTADYYTSQKLEISAECLSALELPLGTPDYRTYSLAELGESAFIAKYGKQTRIQKTDNSLECAYALDKTFGLAADNTPGATIKAVQELLKENGFLMGTATTLVNADMISAVKAAQSYYDLTVTGYADAQLIECLIGHAPMAETKPDSPETQYAHETENIAFNVNAWWFADRAETTVPGGGVSVSDRDNVLMVFDGDIASYALSGVSLSWEVKAEAVLDGMWAFHASMYVETQEGTVLSTTLGMLREGRLLVTCEVPAHLMDRAGEWVLKISAGGQEFELALTK